MARHGQYNRQMREQIAMHSCIISHSPCGLNRIIIFALLPDLSCTNHEGAAIMSKTWFITGASSGFGQAFALARGYNVVATARDPAKLQALVVPIRASIGAMNNNQEGDLLKATAIGETTLLRLQLGADAVAAVRGHAETLLADLAAWDQVATDTRLDGDREVRQ
jgi:hypothetical protein